MKRTGYGKIAEAIRREMADGRYRAGGMLPPVAELCKRFDAAEYSVRHALHQLREEGLVSITKHLGTVATPKAAGIWKGQVLFVHTSTSAAYYAQRLALRLVRRFEASGWLLHPVFLDANHDGQFDTEPLMRHLAGGLSFAIVLGDSRQIAELLDRAAVPYVFLDGSTRDFPNARAVLRTETAECYAELIAVLKARGVRTLHEFDFERRLDRSFKSQLAMAGIDVHRTLSQYENESVHSLGEVRAVGHKAVMDFLAGTASRAHLPDVILFDDDYLAFGGIDALLEAGLRIPDDVRIVTWSSKGNEPALGVSLARLENDLDASADAVSDYVLTLLAGRRRAPPHLKVRFIPGESL